MVNMYFQPYVTSEGMPRKPKADEEFPSLFPKEGLLVFYEQLHHNRRDYVGRMWGTVQYFTTIVTSLITLAIGGGFVLLQNQEKISASASLWAKLLLALIFAIASGLSCAAVQNLRRECENEYVQMALILSTERILGLQATVPDASRFFANEVQIIPNYLSLPSDSFPKKDPSRIQVPTVAEFVKIMISKERSFYKFFRRVFYAFIGLSGLLASVLIVWATFPAPDQPLALPMQTPMLTPAVHLQFATPTPTATLVPVGTPITHGDQ